MNNEDLKMAVCCEEPDDMDCEGCVSYMDCLDQEAEEADRE